MHRVSGKLNGCLVASGLAKTRKSLQLLVTDERGREAEGLALHRPQSCPPLRHFLRHNTPSRSCEYLLRFKPSHETAAALQRHALQQTQHSEHGKEKDRACISGAAPPKAPTHSLTLRAHESKDRSNAVPRSVQKSGPFGPASSVTRRMKDGRSRVPVRMG